jgi:small subunit ribosomal protein S25e
LAAASSSRSKQKKKKWSKGKVHERKDNAIVFDQESYDKFIKEVPKMKTITLSLLSERLKVSASLARRGIRILEEEGKIQRIVKHGSMLLYTRV